MNTNLHQSVQAGDLSRVRKLLADGANVNAKDKYGNTSLHYAITTVSRSYSLDNVMKLMLLLIDKGADVNAGNQNNQTPLHWAAAYGREEIVELLVKKRALVNVKDKDGHTPLDWAQRSEYQKIVDFLTIHGADKFIRKEKSNG